jgi:hypothetical protein
VVGSCGFSRTELAATLCEVLDWTRPNGGLKVIECRQFLEEIEARGYLELPARQPGRPRGRATSVTFTEAGAERPVREGALADVAPVSLELVSSAETRALWRELVERHHYLGHKTAYGAHLRYLVWIATPAREAAGCLQYSSPARRLAPRDRWIGWDDASRQRNLQRVICNSRFLVLPWLRIKGLASHVLSLGSRIVADDWEEAYRVRPLLIESFVDPERFEGTCYRAANWIEAGETAGRGRDAPTQHANRPVKTCWLYPLSPRAREELRA